MTPEALFAAACDRLLGANSTEQVAVAASGGSDSTALLVLACARLGPARIEAVSVDHGLRVEAADEIAQVAALCASLGCGHTILRWDSWDQSGNLQAEARAARYRLMADWAQGPGIGMVLLGHTADDQAETVLMRLARGSGVDGLAAMQPLAMRDGVRWARPLLDMTRDDLRAFLTARGIGWSEDPSNEDDGFDRIRLRQMMAELSKIGLSRDRLLQTADHMSRARDALRHATLALAQQITQQEAGDVIIERTGFEAAPEELQSRLLAAALCFVSGHSYRPRFAPLRALIKAQAGTLHGARLSSTRESLRVSREWAALRDITCAPDMVFDGRWRLTGPARDGDHVRALGEDGISALEDWRAAGLPRASLAAHPSVWRGNALIAAPSAGQNLAWQAELVGNRADFLAYLTPP